MQYRKETNALDSVEFDLLGNTETMARLIANRVRVNDTESADLEDLVHFLDSNAISNYYVRFHQPAENKVTFYFESKFDQVSLLGYLGDHPEAEEFLPIF